MFLKKRAQPEWTPADQERERLTCQCMDAESDLENRVKQVIVRKGVIDLYPDGPDKDRAIKDFEAAQYSMLCAIGTMDGLRNDLRSYIETHKDSFDVTASWPTPTKLHTSHHVIERTYEMFFNECR